MTITIESGIPMPEAERRRRRAKYTFDTMRVGDSFAVSAAVKNPAQLAARANKACKPKIFQVRKFDGVFRLWRTA